MSEQVDRYTPREQSRLATFHNLLNRSMEAEAVNRAGGKRCWGSVNEQGQITQPWIEMDERFIYMLEHVAQSMYETDFRGNPKLEQAAIGIRDQLRSTYDTGTPATSADELERIWEIEDELRNMGGGEPTL